MISKIKTIDYDRDRFQSSTVRFDGVNYDHYVFQRIFLPLFLVVPEMLVGGISDWNQDGGKNLRRIVPGETESERAEALNLGTIWNFEVSRSYRS